VGFFSKKNKLLVGLDIGSSSVKICELHTIGKRNNTRYRLQKLGIVQLPHDSAVDGDIIDSNAVVAAIREVIAEQKIKSKDVAISLCGQQVMIKKMTFQAMSQPELTESIRWEAESFFPAGQSIDNYVLAYDVLEERKSDGNIDIILVACRKEKYESYIDCVIRAGLKPAQIGVDVFALQSAYEANTPPGVYDEVVALINIGACFTNLCMLIGSKSVFWRDIAFGGNRYTEKVMNDWSVTRDGAEALKQGISVENREPAEIESSLAAVSDSFADELLRNADFFRTSFKVDRLDRIVLSGGGAKTPNLVGVLKDRFRIKVEILNPFNLIEVDERAVGHSKAEDIGSAASVVLGLALREKGN
jgi:type IV pilus assembly protein PilM